MPLVLQQELVVRETNKQRPPASAVAKLILLLLLHLAGQICAAVLNPFVIKRIYSLGIGQVGVMVLVAAEFFSLALVLCSVLGFAIHSIELQARRTAKTVEQSEEQATHYSKQVTRLARVSRWLAILGLLALAFSVAVTVSLYIIVAALSPSLNLMM
jgi:hypothetical protein